MKTAYYLFLLLLSFRLAADPEKRILHFELNPERVYTLPTHYTSGVTTVMFPSEIEGLFAANAALNQIANGTNPSFFVAYTPGSYYFSVRALKEKAEGYINVIYGQKTYIIRLLEQGENAAGSVSFRSGGTSGTGNSGRFAQRGISAWLLKSCLDKAKAWDAVKDKTHDGFSGVAVCDDEHLTDYDTVKCRIRRVWRFEKHDVLVFYITLENTSEEILYYNPREVALSLGDRKCFLALADASGELPPKSETIMFGVVTSTSDGIRNLAAKNDWRVLLFADTQRVARR